MSLLDKYADILREEINVKDISEFSSDKPIVKIYKPLGSALSAKFGKDTGQIIANGKQGNVRELGGGVVEVFSPNGNKRELSVEDYEIVYEGLEGDDLTVEDSIIVKLDLNITEDLKREGVAREISRFLNQMRKDADFAVDDRVKLTYSSEDADLIGIMQEFVDFFKDEALLLSMSQDAVEGEVVSEFTNNNKKIIFGLKI